MNSDVSTKTERQRLGDAGEAEAAEYLRQKGYKILDRNWRPAPLGEARYGRPKSNRKTNLGELDIIARCGKVICFCEVKTLTKSDTPLFSPEDHVNYFKRKKLIVLSKLYLAFHDLRDILWQIDVLAVWFDPVDHRYTIKHFENAIEE